MTIDLRLDSIGETIKHAENMLDMALVVKATRVAFKRAMPEMRNQYRSRLNDQIRVTKKDFDKKITVTNLYLKTPTVEKMGANLKISDYRLNLIRFTKRKKPLKQKGKKVRRRSKIKFQYGAKTPVKVAPVAFIAKMNKNMAKNKPTKGGKGEKTAYAVYRRKPGTQSTGKGRERTNKNIKFQTGPIVWLPFIQATFRQPVDNLVGKRLVNEFVTAYNFFFKKERGLL